MRERQPSACVFAQVVFMLDSNARFGTVIGTANCGVDGGSWRRNPSTRRSIVRVYLLSALYSGLCSPANSMVFEMAESESETV